MRAATQLGRALPAPASPAPLAAVQAKLDAARAELAKVRAELDRVRKINAASKAAEPVQAAGPVNVVARELEQHQTMLQGRYATLVRVSFPASATQVQVSEETRDALARAAMQAKRIVVRGRTDGIGSVAANRKVARARALSAKRMLINAGVPAAKITAVYLPEGDYIAPNDTEEGRAKNRRVDFVFVSPGAERIRVALSDGR
jgi:outer membrane protein OmpA-like peptidoglycan-associated protein